VLVTRAIGHARASPWGILGVSKLQQHNQQATILQQVESGKVRDAQPDLRPTKERPRIPTRRQEGLKSSMSELSGRGGPPQDRGQRMLYTIAEACRLLSISRSTLYKLIQLDLLKSCKVAGRRLVPHESLQALIEESK
jgi:excisionase family DNA binding protein